MIDMPDTKRLRELLAEAADELDAYYAHEYQGDHPYSVRKRKQAMDANPAREAINALPGLLDEVDRLREVASLAIKADNLREVYHRLPNDRNRIGEKRSPKSRARDSWLRAFCKAAKTARAALQSSEANPCPE